MNTLASEHTIQNQVRNAITGLAHVFRVNVGTAWTGDAKRLPNGTMLISNPRPLSSGLPPGFADLVGWRSVTVTEDMVGRQLAVFCALEVKAPGKSPTLQQQAFLKAVETAGGIAGVVRSVADAESLLTQRSLTLSETHMTSQQLIDALTSLGWTNERAAQELGVSVRTLSYYRSGTIAVPKAIALLLTRMVADLRHAG